MEKLIDFEQDSIKVFSNMDIKGGVVITHHDDVKDYCAIKVFTPYMELNSIINKTAQREKADSLMSKVYIQNNIFDRIPLFSEEKINKDDVVVVGVNGMWLLSTIFNRLMH